jgi:hypothetical protein
MDPHAGWTWSSERIRSWATKVSVPQHGRVVDLPGVELSSSFSRAMAGDYARSLHLGLSWSVPTLVMLVPAGVATARAWRRLRRRRSGACRECGCDLRASPERCPEVRGGDPTFLIRKQKPPLPCGSGGVGRFLRIG